MKTALNNFEKNIVLVIFSFLPLSLILGSAVINLNIIIIDLYFLYHYVKSEKIKLQPNNFLLIIIAIWTYLILNSLLQNSLNKGHFDIIDDGLIRSFFLIRYIFFLVSLNYFFNKLKEEINKIFFIWFVIIFLVIIDVIIEKLLGHNILGYISPSEHRVVSFFKDELVVGAFLMGTAFVSLNYIKNRNYIFLIFLIIIPIIIFLTGERANFIKSLIILIILINLIFKKKIIYNSLIIITISSAIFIILNSSNKTFERYNSFFDRLKKSEKIFTNIKHYHNYKIGLAIFKDNKLFGVGNKKFRQSCKEEKYKTIDTTNWGCSTHPHQIYIELLAEQGIIGFVLIFSSYLIYLFKAYKVKLFRSNYIAQSSITYTVICWIPILPSGSFFSTFNFTIFWINLSISYFFLNKK